MRSGTFEKTSATETPTLRSRPLRDVLKKNQRPIYKRWWFWVLAVLLLLVVGVRIALNPVAAHFTQKGLDGLTGFKGTFTSVSVSLFPPRYLITDLKLIQDGTDPKEPLVYIRELEATALGRKLLKGDVVVIASVRQGKFFIKAGETVAPPEAKEAAEKVVKEVKKDDFDLSKTLSKVFPMRVDRVEMRDSELVLIDATDPKAPRFWVNDIELVMDNLVTRKSLDENAPLTLTMRAVVQRTGILKAMATADVLDEGKPSFTGQAQLTGLRLESLYSWAAAKTGTSPKGKLDSFINFNSAKGKLDGSVKVLVQDVEIRPATKEPSDAIKAKLSTMVLKVLSDRVGGREAVGTTLPIKGNLTAPDAQVWPTILGVIRNAFVQAIDWGFGDLPLETAGKKENPIEQAAKGLDKKEDGPKAQPTAK